MGGLDVIKPKHEGAASSPPREHFDLARVRRNWSRALEIPGSDPPVKGAANAPPVDPYSVARALVARVDKLARTAFPDHLTSLEPFLARASEIVEKLAATPPGAGDTKTQKEELRAVLVDLEDLFEVYAGLGR